MKALTVLDEPELYAAAKNLRAPLELVQMVAKTGQLPVPNFSAGGIATPADAALMMQLGAQTVFVGSGIFMKEGNIRLKVSRYTKEDAELLGVKEGDFVSPEERAEAESRAKAIVRAATHFDNPAILAEASEDCLGAMKGLAVAGIAEADRMQHPRLVALRAVLGFEWCSRWEQTNPCPRTGGPPPPTCPDHQDAARSARPTRSGLRQDTRYSPCLARPHKP